MKPIAVNVNSLFEAVKIQTKSPLRKTSAEHLPGVCAKITVTCKSGNKKKKRKDF